MIQVKHNQSFLDVVLQSTGGFNGLLENAVDNAKSITDELIPGTMINVTTGIEDVDIYNFFANKSVTPAFALTGANILENSSAGIGYMQLENNFKVS
jgi:hypothetical protein